MIDVPLPDARQTGADELPTERGCPFDPPGAIGDLRDRQPLTRFRFPDGHIGWLVTSHELARAVMGDSRFSLTPGGPPHVYGTRAAMFYDGVQRDPDFPDATRTVFDRYQREGRLSDALRDPEIVRTLHERPLRGMPFMSIDPPAHTRLRRALSGYFTVRRVSEHREIIEQIVAGRLDAMEQAGPPVDLVETFADAVPSLFTCSLYGLPESERGTFERLSAAIVSPNITVEGVLQASEEFRAFARALIEHKRANPSGDMLSTLIRGGELTDDEIVTIAIVLVRASHSTTSSALAFSVATLLQDRARWNALWTASAPIGHIVEELLRYTTVVQSSDVRTALEDVEVGGCVIKAFETVVVSLSAANRDPLVFPEPDRVDLTRQASKELAFGYGIHQCLGQHLARLELQVALTGLAHRYPGLDLAVPVADIPWRGGDRNPYGPEQLPVTW